MVIYKITNRINGKMWGGQTVRSPQRRWEQHKKSAASGVNHPLYDSMNCHGVENFTFEIVDTANDQEELDKKEKAFIALHDLTNRDKGYNLESGGKGKGFVHEETRIKISKSNTGKKRTKEENAVKSLKSKEMWERPEYREKMALTLEKLKTLNTLLKKGKPLSEDHKIKSTSASKKALARPFVVYKAIADYNRLIGIGEFIGKWDNQIDCAKDLMISYRCISECLNGRSKMRSGYVFKRINNDKSNLINSTDSTKEN